MSKKPSPVAPLKTTPKNIRTAAAVAAQPTPEEFPIPDRKAVVKTRQTGRMQI